MRKKQMRRLASALALTMAAGLFTGCGSPAPKESESASAETEKTEAGESQEAGKTEDSSAAAKDTLIIATANELSLIHISICPGSWTTTTAGT